MDNWTSHALHNINFPASTAWRSHYYIFVFIYTATWLQHQAHLKHCMWEQIELGCMFWKQNVNKGQGCTKKKCNGHHCLMCLDYLTNIQGNIVQIITQPKQIYPTHKCITISAATIKPDQKFCCLSFILPAGKQLYYIKNSHIISMIT